MSAKNEPLSGLLKRFSRGRLFIFAVLGAFAGVMLLLLPSGGESKSAAAAPETESAEIYRAELERRATELVCALPGVADCRVVITLSEGYKYVYASDMHLREEGAEPARTVQSDKTVVLADNGNGKSPAVVSETMPAVAGVAVVIPGADYDTKYRVIELMCALFDVKSNRVSVQG